MRTSAKSLPRKKRTAATPFMAYNLEFYVKSYHPKNFDPEIFNSYGIFQKLGIPILKKSHGIQKSRFYINVNKSPKIIVYHFIWEFWTFFRYS